MEYTDDQSRTEQNSVEKNREEQSVLTTIGSIQIYNYCCFEFEIICDVYDQIVNMVGFLCSKLLRHPIWHGLYLLRVVQVTNMVWSRSTQGGSGTQYGMVSICSELFKSPIRHGLYLLRVAQVPNMAWSLYA